MEDAYVASLEKEIEDLALDRPPCLVIGLGGSDITEDIFDDINKIEVENPSIDDLSSTHLATCLIDKPLLCQDETFDPLSSSEKNFDTVNIIEKDTAVPSVPTLHVTDTSEIVEIPPPEHVIPDTINVVSSSNSNLLRTSVVQDYKLEDVTTDKPVSKANLVSCLKKDDQGSDHITRYVHFTDEPGIVTEFIEPVNPWRDMCTPSKGEVISFYKNVCQKMKCKPLDKVIKQIQDLADLSARSGTLVLRGCRLDNKSCEALESVFKRIQFENLDLENCSLEEDGATAVLEMIEFYHSTCKLNIACNPKIGLRGWQALCRMLRKTPCLTYLDARRTILTEITMPTFGRCLKADPFLKVLHLEGVFLSGRPLLILTTALKYNRLLEELYLGDNDLTSSDGPSLGAMLTYNTTLQLLDLRNNQLKDIGLAHIGNGLSDQSEQPCDGLCSLIMWNNGLTHDGMSYLCEALVKTTTLKALNLGQNRIGDLGVRKLKPGLIKNKSLRKLGFLNTKLGSEGAVALAEILADSWTITRIDIRENNVQTAGLMAFSMALKVNQSLLRLDLDKDIRKEPGMETVMQSVLVDIYNLCYRNKQLIKRNITPTLSASISSMSSSISRQSSTSSEINEPFSVDDVFHPETAIQEVTPFSPVTECPVDVDSVGIIFNSTNKVIPGKNEVDCTPSIESLGNPISPAFETSNNKRIRTYSDPVKKNPDPAISEKRTSRFSVTKILDSLGNHAAGVANKIAAIDTKLKKQHSRDKIENKSSELLPVLDQNQPIELENFKSQSKPNEPNGLINSSNDMQVNKTIPIEPVNTKSSNIVDQCDESAVEIKEKDIFIKGSHTDDLSEDASEEISNDDKVNSEEVSDHSNITDGTEVEIRETYGDNVVNTTDNIHDNDLLDVDDSMTKITEDTTNSTNPSSGIFDNCVVDALASETFQQDTMDDNTLIANKDESGIIEVNTLINDVDSIADSKADNLSNTLSLVTHTDEILDDDKNCRFEGLDNSEIGLINKDNFVFKNIVDGNKVKMSSNSIQRNIDEDTLSNVVCIDSLPKMTEDNSNVNNSILPMVNISDNFISEEEISVENELSAEINNLNEISFNDGAFIATSDIDSFEKGCNKSDNVDEFIESSNIIPDIQNDSENKSDLYYNTNDDYEETAEQISFKSSVLNSKDELSDNTNDYSLELAENSSIVLENFDIIHTVVDDLNTEPLKGDKPTSDGSEIDSCTNTYVSADISKVSETECSEDSGFIINDCSSMKNNSIYDGSQVISNADNTGGNEISHKSSFENNLTESFTDISDITNVKPSLEFVKITESLDEEESIYIP